MVRRYPDRYYILMLILLQNDLWEVRPASSASSHSTVERLNRKKVSTCPSIHTLITTPSGSAVSCVIACFS